MSSSLRFTGNQDADDLLNDNPLALLIGMLLDQQFPIERAFLAPYLLQQRLGVHLDARDLADMAPSALVDLFSQKPALHRFPKAMAERAHSLCVFLVEHYDGNPDNVWADVSEAEILRDRLLALPGFGDKKVKIFVALLAKRFAVAPHGWEVVCGMYSAPGFNSVADLDSPAALAQLRKQRSDARRKT
ncbi:MAG: HhH-GPD-type base excision DNA repair protein [Acidimicrobiales bacterium]|jgi:uncharacterized HhH-GPD family protein|nr:HhH-GPD-type base excision DNA repair protein [Acidimicrobiales bacterium]